MSSPMPISAGVCCVCFDAIQPGDNARDTEGDWDVHKGKCADKAGIAELSKPKEGGGSMS